MWCVINGIGKTGLIVHPLNDLYHRSKDDPSLCERCSTNWLVTHMDTLPANRQSVRIPECDKEDKENTTIYKSIGWIHAVFESKSEAERYLNNEKLGRGQRIGKKNLKFEDTPLTILTNRCSEEKVKDALISKTNPLEKKRTIKETSEKNARKKAIKESTIASTEALAGYVWTGVKAYNNSKTSNVQRNKETTSRSGGSNSDNPKGKSLNLENGQGKKQANEAKKLIGRNAHQSKVKNQFSQTPRKPQEIMNRYQLITRQVLATKMRTQERGLNQRLTPQIIRQVRNLPVTHLMMMMMMMMMMKQVYQIINRIN